MRGKSHKCVIADSALKRIQVDDACELIRAPAEIASRKTASRYPHTVHGCVSSFPQARMWWRLVSVPPRFTITLRTHQDSKSCATGKRQD
jgi:hypothetical protein